MNENGKILEKTVRLIQEVLRDSQSTKIYNNYKLKNESGNYREFDVLIISNINGFELKIAIECKDYSKAVSVSQIEAFNSKCQRIKGISKKVFVSRKGFQKDAIDSANYFDIDLFTADKITEKNVLQWLSMKQLKFKLCEEISDLVLSLDITTSNELQELNKSFDETIYNPKGDSENIKELIWDTIKYNREIFTKLCLIEWIKIDDKEKEPTLKVPFNLELQNHFIKFKEKKIALFNISLSILVQPYYENVKIVEGRNLLNKDKDSVAKSITFEVGNNQYGDVVIDPKNELSFFGTNKDGELKKLELLLKYNPKTKKFI